MEDSMTQIEKVVLNVGLGPKRDNSSFEEKVLPGIKRELGLIAGQQPVATTAKKSIAGFDVREGDTVGLKVTLRGDKMADFLSRLINVALPRVRDFKGLDLSNVDEFGNLNIGLKDKHVFPEINPDKSEVDFGLQVTIVSDIEDRDEAIEVYRDMDVPLKKDDQDES